MKLKKEDYLLYMALFPMIEDIHDLYNIRDLLDDEISHRFIDVDYIDDLDDLYDFDMYE